MAVEIKIDGMKCEGCAKTVKERFESIEGVTNVTVDREAKKAVVDSSRPIEELEFSNALAETKFTVVK